MVDAKRGLCRNELSTVNVRVYGQPGRTLTAGLEVVGGSGRVRMVGRVRASLGPRPFADQRADSTNPVASGHVPSPRRVRCAMIAARASPRRSGTPVHPQPGPGVESLLMLSTRTNKRDGKR